MTPHPSAPDEPEDLGELTSDAIAGPFRILQRRRGHRYSLDDVMTAFEAVHAQPAPSRCLELGTGIGSVLLMLAYKLPDARFVAVEAQRNSYRLLTENVARNGLGERVLTVHGDLRVAVGEPELRGSFELVTGTPPYVPPGRATPSTDAQRAFARQELRGGVEAYVEAAAHVLAPHGRFVVCADARFPERVLGVAARHGLAPLRRCDVIAREGRQDALFSVFTLARSECLSSVASTHRWVARDAHGARTCAYHEVRAFFGLDQREDPPQQP